MIVLDTNQLEHIRPPDGPLMALLRTIASHRGQTLALSEIALEEHLAHYRHKIEQQEKKVRNQLRELHALVPFAGGELPRFDVDTAVRRLRDQLTADFKILPTSPEILREALRRETQRRLPAKRGWEGKGEGARDVAIWLSAVEASREYGPLYFVSQDKQAFGVKTLHPELNDDIARVLGTPNGHFKYCYGIDVLLAELADVYSPAPTRATLAASDVVREAAIQDLWHSGVHKDIMAADGLFGQGPIAVVSNPGPINAELDQVSSKIEAYRLGDKVFASARLRWKVLTSLQITWLNSVSRDEIEYGCKFSVEETMLLSLDADGQIAAAIVTDRSPLRGLQFDGALTVMPEGEPS
ncbi:PIN domain-containing protein [Nonomuraea ceibae]|uniref:PIN domain-containing protein n=1 Tax=Nonomuraea ceibae TaxID=1935170 RepID=UPI001C5F4EAE|nr:PIN domain-containing protein [Nonomuraea ceibae]